MNRFKNYIWMAAGFAILGAAAGSFTPVSALAQAVKAALIKNIDEPGRAPYYGSNDCNGLGGCTLNFPAVPANKRLVVQFFSAFVQSTNPVSTLPFLEFGDGSRVYADWVVPSANANDWVISQPLTAYIEPGATPKLSVQLSGSTSCNLVGTLIGYLVDLTQ